jgi:hypothetical protein
MTSPFEASLILSGDVAIVKPEVGAAQHFLPSVEVFLVVDVRYFILGEPENSVPIKLAISPSVLSRKFLT